MYLTSDVLAPIERAYGSPRRTEASACFNPREYELLASCYRKGRAHDVTLFIRGPAGEFVVIRKPGYPPEVFRPPSGGVEPGEPFVEGVLREAHALDGFGGDEIPRGAPGRGAVHPGSV